MANANRPTTDRSKEFPTEEQLRSLANRLQTAYREECERGECQCITTEEHKKRLATK